MAQFGIFEVLNCSGEEKNAWRFHMRMGFFAQAVPSADRGRCFVEMLSVIDRVISGIDSMVLVSIIEVRTATV